jgi:hypothetical protein
MVPVSCVALSPPLTICEEDLEQGLVIIEHVIEAAAAPPK